mgnify:CR=1 FL=1
MDIFLWILSLVGAFSVMEFMAWFTHKYIMHGFLWYLHEDHHKKDHDSWFERNDLFPNQLMCFIPLVIDFKKATRKNNPIINHKILSKAIKEEKA